MDTEERFSSSDDRKGKLVLPFLTKDRYDLLAEALRQAERSETNLTIRAALVELRAYIRNYTEPA